MIKKRVKRRNNDLGHKDWWDSECTRKKRILKKLFRKWKKGKMRRETLIEEKKILVELHIREQLEKRKAKEVKEGSRYMEIY